MITEALEEESRDQLELLVGSAIPALVADGQNVSSLARAAGTVAVAVSASLLRALPDEDQNEAAAWLATFFGEYTQAVVEEAVRAEAGA